MLRWVVGGMLCLMLTVCEGSSGSSTATSAPTPASAPSTATMPPPIPTTMTRTPTARSSPTSPPPAAGAGQVSTTIASASATLGEIARQSGGIPAFQYIVVIIFENHGYDEVIGNSSLTHFNQLAAQNVLFTQFYGVAHPSLPNYLALTGGSTFGITSDCGTCYVNETSVADLIEGSGRTWKAYEEDMPSPCYVGFTSKYDQNHDPFIYFDPIRTNAARCQRSVVPFTQLNADLSANQLPNFAFITPNLCHSAHSCSLSSADAWVGSLVTELQSSPALGQDYAIFLLFDESSSSSASCCGLPPKAGGRVPAILISPKAKSAFQDATPLDHYSLLKIILEAWNLPALGFTASPATQPISGVWK